MDKQVAAADEALRLSTNQTEFSEAKDELDRVEGLYQEFMDGLQSLRETVNHLTSAAQGVEFMETEYNRLKTEREEHRTAIETATGTALPDYDASQSPPEWVEPPALPTADDSTATDPTATDDSTATDPTATDSSV
jgi:predicted nuclease with TOPRIM domain